MDTGNRTLEALHARYCRVNILAQQTQLRYDLVVRNLAQCIGGKTAQPSDIALDRITIDALLGFRDWSLQRMRPTSFNTERCHLSALLNFAVRQGWLPANPFRDVPRAPVPKLLPKSIPKPDMRVYIELLQTAWRTDHKGRRVDLLDPQWFWLAVVKTFYLSGMRKRQLVGLRWDDIDFTDRTIRLRSETSKNRREWMVPLPDALLPNLLKLRERTFEVRGSALGCHQVFCLPLFSCRPERFRIPVMKPDNVDNFFQRLRKHLPKDAPRITAHRIRHTTATILANSVPNLKVVQEQLGHSSILTTYGYVHPDLASMRRALDAL